ncbi:hypothetical protein V2G26_019153 [Clonostachys chloroleuca]
MAGAYLFLKRHLPRCSYRTSSHSINHHGWFTLPSNHRSFSTFLVSPRDLHKALRVSRPSARNESQKLASLISIGLLMRIHPIPIYYLGLWISLPQ